MSQALERPPWAKEAEWFIERHGLADAVSVSRLDELIRLRTTSWKTSLADDRYLHFLRLHLPLVEREEVLTGNLLFADFVRKCALGALRSKDEVLALTGDLEDAYYLIVTGEEIEDLALSVRSYVEARLPNLFFGKDNPEHGVHGDPETMFGFTKSDFEPYPVFAVPTFLAEELYQSVNSVLDKRIKEDKLVNVNPDGGSRRVSLELRNIQAALAFFFGRTSGGKGDVQSPANFLLRLVQAYGVLGKSEVKDALRLTEFTKDAIKDAFDKATLDEEKTRELFSSLVQRLRDSKASDAAPADSWFLPFIRDNGKLLNAAPEEYLNSILDGASLGFASLGVAERGNGLVCRVCGSQLGSIGEKNILLGISVGKFHNQSGSHEKGARICARCALFSFLNTKLFGMTSAGKFPVPSRENLIFHYGHHTDEYVRRLEKIANDVFESVGKYRQVRRETLEVNKKLEESERISVDAEWTAARLREIVASGSESDADAEQKHELLRKLLFDNQLAEQAASEMFGRGEIKVFSLGAEEPRLVVFALPHFRDELELAHKRFAKNRSTVFSLMAFLSDLCGCDGPFFFQSTPRLEAAGSRGVFYISDRPYESRRYRRRYEALSKFAFNAVGGKPSDALKDRLKLAIELENAPLATFDSVLRASPVRVGEKADEGKYRRIANRDGAVEYDQRLKVYSPWEYLSFFEEMRKLEKEEVDDPR